MTGEVSPWRVNDVVAYDRLRSAASEALARLRLTPDADRARTDMHALYSEVVTVDAYDRGAVNDLAARVDTLLHELRGREL